jgi:hypothetical protein
MRSSQRLLSTARLRVFVGAWAATVGTLIPIGLHLGGDSLSSQAIHAGGAALVAVVVALIAASITRSPDRAGLVWVIVGPIGFTVSYIPHAIDLGWLVGFGAIALLLGPVLGCAALIADRQGRYVVVTSLLVTGLATSGVVFAIFWYFGVGLYAPFYALTVSSALPRPGARRAEPVPQLPHASRAL